MIISAWLPMDDAALNEASLDLLHSGRAEALASEVVVESSATGKFPRPALVMSQLKGGDFELDGLNIHFKRVSRPGNAALACSALVGYLPYTVEAAAKREALAKILAATTGLRRARFTLNRQSYIHLNAEVALPPEPEDCDIALGLLGVIQEARPFLSLIARQL